MARSGSARGRADPLVGRVAPRWPQECRPPARSRRSRAATSWIFRLVRANLRPGIVGREQPVAKSTSAPSTGDDLDLAVDAVDDTEFALVGPVVVACDGAILPLRQDHAWKGTDRFLDH